MGYDKMGYVNANTITIRFVYMYNVTQYVLYLFFLLLQIMYAM